MEKSRGGLGGEPKRKSYKRRSMQEEEENKSKGEEQKKGKRGQVP